MSYHMPFLSNNSYIHTFRSNNSMKQGNKYFYFIINSFTFTIRHYSSQFATIRHNSPLFVAIRHYSSQFAIIRHYSSPFVTIRDCLHYLVTIRHYSRLFALFGHHSSLFATICIIRSLFVTIRDYLHYSGYIASTAMFYELRVKDRKFREFLKHVDQNTVKVSYQT